MSGRLRALVCVAPLVAFLGVFFVWPLWTMALAAVQGGTVRTAFPRTAEAIAVWSGAGPPPATVTAALVQDLRADIPQDRFGDAVRALNSLQPGFRTLLPRTAPTIRAAEPNADIDLTAIDPRWGQASVWQAFRRAVPAYTDANLLAALDLRRSDDGSIGAVPPEIAGNRAVALRTFTIAFEVTLACAAIGLPFALITASLKGWARDALLQAALLPLWTSLLVRTAGWTVLLQDQGLINGTLRTLGLTDASLPLLYNRAGVLVAMTHVLLPFMILPIHASLVAVPGNLMPAAASLGASPMRAFRHVLLPLAMPGLLSGALLVFTVALGYYITPALVGGPTDQMLSAMIAFYALGTANWGMAAALGLLLLLPTVGLFLVYGRLARAFSVRA